MMILGVLTLAAAAALYFRYRPAWGDGAKLCALSAAMGLGGLAAGEAGALFVALEAILALVVLTCALFALHREKVLRARAARRGAEKKAAPRGKVIFLRGAAAPGAARRCV